MLALVGKGLGRQGAYEIVQSSAMRAFQGQGDFRMLLGQDPEVARLLSPDELDQCFALERALGWAEVMVERALDAP